MVSQFGGDVGLQEAWSRAGVTPAQDQGVFEEAKAELPKPRVPIYDGERPLKVAPSQYGSNRLNTDVDHNNNNNL